MYSACLAKLDQGKLTSNLAHLGELLVGRVQSDPQTVDFAEPAAFSGFPQPVVEVGENGQQQWFLRRVRPQDRASDAGLTEMILDWASGYPPCVS